MPGEFVLGWAMAVYVGYGSFGSETRLDLSDDIFGLTGRYKLKNGDVVGFFYDPVQVYSTPIGGYFGSKIEVKYIHEPFKAKLERGGSGIFNGFLSPNELQQTLHAASVQYRFGDSTWFLGLRYSALSDKSNSLGNGIMLYVGSDW